MVEQFLRLPETKPALEFVGGRVVQKMSPKTTHSVLQSRLWLALYNHASREDLGEPFTELRCTFGGESLVPDVAYFVRSRIPIDAGGGYVDDVQAPPDLLIEILSPGQTVREMTKKLTRAVAKGVRLAWLIQPSRKRVFVARPGRPIEVLEGEVGLTGEEVLPGFDLPISTLFGWLVRK